VKRSVIIILAAALTGFASLANAQGKIGVVNVRKLMSEAPQAKEASEALNAEFSVRAKDIQNLDQLLKLRQEKLQKDGPTMTELQRSAASRELSAGVQDLQLKQNAFEDEINARQDEERTRVGNVLTLEIQAYAKAQGYDLIVGDGVIYASPAYDVTGPILEALKKKAGVAAPAATPAKPPAAAPATKSPATPPAKP
jgi:outer membrane protein